MDLQLKGQTAVVIGGARGIGRAIAEAFAAEGAHVALFDRDPEVNAAASEIGKRFGVQSRAIVGDVMQLDALTRAAADIRAALGRLDHVVFAVAIGSGKFGFPFWNLAPADWEAVLRECDRCGQRRPRICRRWSKPAAAPCFSRVHRRADRLADRSALQCSKRRSSTSPSAAKDLAAYGVRVNTLCPGMVKTVLNRAVWEAMASPATGGSPAAYEEGRGENPPHGSAQPLAGRRGTWPPWRYSLRQPRAKNVTGQTINVDGGMVMHW